MIILTKKLTFSPNNKPNLTIFLTAEERLKIKHTISIKESNNEDIKLLKLNLNRGNILKSGDILTNDKEDFFVEIQAKSEVVITVKSNSKLSLLKAAYHLGNRHVNLEIGEDYLRFSPDYVLESMIVKLGLNIHQEITPFFPEVGAYKH
ncbi:MAG: urease accessory protein UreE [Cyanobacteria bacterium]|nr:urease accessory protein UreE [Cyanobacteria bacterium CG_2015-16_32_12]NCO78716.1 urease accessory protein UreE [Cyanobacteria bacterium CG_2015-22_32_23]NCQ03209.1 urease accessory protein UreE [Cyanobacteria bacterium CG_2015-09_32_10]NCS85356.1 urease accessory protein UreE [Cyanobacteria bacterium CG_2015-02_32_10]